MGYGYKLRIRKRAAIGLATPTRDNDDDDAFHTCQKKNVQNFSFSEPQENFWAGAVFEATAVLLRCIVLRLVFHQDTRQME